MREDPHWKDEIANRLAAAGLPPAREAEIVEELAGHLEDEYGRLQASGTNEDDAREIVLEGLQARLPLAEAIRGVEPAAGREAIPMGTPRGSTIGNFLGDL